MHASVTATINLAQTLQQRLVTSQSLLNLDRAFSVERFVEKRFQFSVSEFFGHANCRGLEEYLLIVADLARDGTGCSNTVQSLAT